jgi:hypothetical protein
VSMPTELRQKRKALALSMLGNGETRAAVARAVGLSPSRISAMFKKTEVSDEEVIADKSNTPARKRR